MDSPLVRVGIATQQEVHVIFNEVYRNTATGELLSGGQCALFENGCVVFNEKRYKELLFEPTCYRTSSFDLRAVTIGIHFHWQRQEDQRFRGSLRLLAVEDGILVLNEIGVEEYLVSVISSEMNASASTDLLRAHAVISRSWLLAQLEKNKELTATQRAYQTCFRTENELVRWYDREDHTLFNVCADDHCQRYQGITRASAPHVTDVINETRGEVLTFRGQICDARFSKCCGGATEEFQHCWEPVSHPYLQTRRDAPAGTAPLPDLTNEHEALRWIHSAPDAFCNTRAPEILQQVLNNYDRETHDFYRWQVSYTQDELSDLIRRKSGLEFGRIIDLLPLSRGNSARITRLKIVGTLRTFILGKELEIRRTLSESHLYSAAFTVKKEVANKGIPTQFTLTGAGWGHGVGLCQIGAAVMAVQGYSYKEILAHYFAGSVIEKRW